MTFATRRWAAALAEHEREVGAFAAAARAVGAAGWRRAAAPGRWPPAALVLHVCLAYELGASAAEGGPSMRRRTAAPAAWLSRTVLLPLLLATRRFPRGAPAPAEVRPDLAEAATLGRDEAVDRLLRAAAYAARALRQAAVERPALRFTHAYFGPLRPLATLRLLSAHTRHHAGGLRAVTEGAVHGREPGAPAST